MHRARSVMIGLDVLLVILFLAGYAALYVHPRHLWWLQVVAIGLPYLSLIIVGATVAAAVLGAWELFGVHAVLCVLVLVRFFPAERMKASRPAVEEEPLTVVSFNARYAFAHPDWPNAMVPLVKEYRPHLIALQEVYVWFLEADPWQSSYPHILTLMQSFQYAVSKPAAPYDKRLDRPVLFRLPIDEQQLIPLANTEASKPPNTVTQVRFQWEGEEVVLYNVHLRSFNNEGAPLLWYNPLSWFRRLWEYKEDYLIRAHEAEQIRRMIRNERRPFILCGDFNSTPHDWVYHHLAAGLQDAFRMEGRGWGATYHTRLPFIRIDHLLASPEWQVRGARIAGTTFSDHLPLVATLALRQPADRGDGRAAQQRQKRSMRRQPPLRAVAAHDGT